MQTTLRNPRNSLAEKSPPPYAPKKVSKGKAAIASLMSLAAVAITAPKQAEADTLYAAYPGGGVLAIDAASGIVQKAYENYIYDPNGSNGQLYYNWADVEALGATLDGKKLFLGGDPNYLDQNLIRIFNIGTNALDTTLDFGAGTTVSKIQMRKSGNAYVRLSLSGASNLAVVDTKSESILKTINLPFSTTSLDVAQNEVFAYAVPHGNTQVAEIDLASGNVVSAFTPTYTGTDSNGNQVSYTWIPGGVKISPDSSQVFVSGSSSPTSKAIALRIDTATNSVVSVVQAPSSHPNATCYAIGYAPDGQHAYCQDAFDNKYLAVDNSNQVAVFGPNFYEIELALTPDSKTIYVGPSIGAYDATTYTPIPITGTFPPDNWFTTSDLAMAPTPTTPFILSKTLGQPNSICGCERNPVPTDPAVHDPITLSTGNVYEKVTDYESGGTNKLTFTRSYNSQAVWDDATTQSHELGVNWRSNYDRYLNVVNSGGTTTVYAERADGRVLTFNSDGNGGWTGDTDVDTKLVQNNSTTWTLTDHNDTVETYQDTGTGTPQLQTITARNGYNQTLSYNASNQLASVQDSYNRTLSFTYYSNGLLETVTTPGGQASQGGLVLTYTYDASGVNGSNNDRLINVGYNTSPATSQTYLYENTNFPFALTGRTDENGNRANTWAYDERGRGTSSSLANGLDLNTISYDDTHDTRTVTNALNQQTDYQFTTLQNVPKLTRVDHVGTAGPGSGSTRFITYDANGYQATTTDWNGNTTTYVNDSHGDPTSITEATGTTVERKTIITYDPTFIHLPSQITKEQTQPSVQTLHTINLTYDANGNLHTKSVSDPVTSTSRTWTYTYDGTGEMLTAKGPRTDVNQTTTYTYSGGNLATATNALAQQTSFDQYNADGRLLKMTDPNGLVTNFTYDTRGLPLSRTEGNETTAFVRDAAENITQTVEPDASALTFTLDAANRVTRVTNSLGEHTDYTLDNAGNRTQVDVYDATNTLNRTHSYTYDGLSRMITSVGAASGETTTYGYDNNGNLTDVTDPAGDHTQIAYDALDRKSSVTDPLGKTTTISYDALDNVTQMATPRGVTTNYVRDGFGEALQTQSPDSGTTVRTFDLAGNVASLTDANNNTTNYTYDALNRIKTATYQDGTVSNYYYDSQTNAIGRLKQIADPTPAGENPHTTYFGYDQHGRVISKQNQYDGLQYTASYDSTTGKLTSETYPSGMVVGYQYDAAGQTQEIDINGQAYIAHVKHQPFGPAREWDWVSNYTHYARTFDSDGRLASYPLATDTRTLTYDAASRVTNIDDSVNHEVIGYDADSRVTSYTGPNGNGNQTITYDEDGNRTKLTTSAGTANYTITNGTEQLINRTTFTGGTVDYTYDNVGNTLTEGGIGWSYDNRNRTIATIAANGETDYTYDGLNERIRRLGVGGNERYAWAATGKELTGRLLGQYTGSNVAYNEIIMLDGTLPVGGQPAGAGPTASRDATLRIFPDQLGAPRRATDNHMTLAWTWDPDVFGVGDANVQPSTMSAFYEDLRFPGQVYDPESGNFQNRARTYVPGRGRYLQVDPIGLKGGINPYVYVGNDPADKVDPLGLEGDFALPGGISEPVTIGGYTPIPNASVSPPYTLHDALNYALNNPQGGYYLMEGGGGLVLGGVGRLAVDICQVERGAYFGTRFMGNIPRYNSGDFLRVGWSEIKALKEYRFRIAGDLVKRLKPDGHINLWPPKYWFNKLPSAKPK